jgi:hypothetical protein
MKVIQARNVNHALSYALEHLLYDGIREKSRNGDVLVATGPVMTIYEKPTERVLFSPVRDANPFFHLMESLWMLAGCNDLAFPLMFNSRFKEYSDDGVVVHGAYGHRWRRWFGMDQLAHITAELREKPESRRAVLAMWSPYGDLCKLQDKSGKVFGGLAARDVPCNTHAYFDLRGGKLNMTVCNRSNDAIWGAYGANAVHFSVLLEYLAAWIGVPVGVYRQFSNNLHAYLDIYGRDDLCAIKNEASCVDYYQEAKVTPASLVSTPIESWNKDLIDFIATPDCWRAYKDPFFNEVARPMYLAWRNRKEKTGSGLAEIERVTAPDWKLACTLWIARREKRKN